ncbi:MAG: hypothetical protein DMF63_08690 [Acidobacteria bacterium]|nr:MAG: hypothetical protein DMF63_08690 [Acidobacteriota bacterium]
MEELTLEEKLRINADLIKEHLSPAAGFELAFNEASVAWIDGFIERQRSRDDFDLAASDGLAQKLGSFVGECMCNEFGGKWKQLDEGLGIVFSDGNAAFPLTKVRKQFANGSDDSILSFYRSAAALFSRQG